MRIAKYLPIGGTGMDAHCALPPITPPVPPSPTPIPYYRWIVAAVQTGSALLTGKFCNISESTEGMGVILWQYDWGPLQPHIPVPPIVTPSIITTGLGSTVKYFLPSFSVPERIDGGILAAISGGNAPVAVSWPIFAIVTESCQDLGTAGIGIVAPTTMCFQAVSTRWVGFNLGDMAAGFIGMAADAAGAAIGSFFGGRLIPGSLDDQLIGGLMSTFSVHLGTLIGSLPNVWRNLTGTVGAGMAISGVVIEVPLVATIGGIVTAPLATNLLNNAAQSVGENWGSKPESSEE